MQFHERKLRHELKYRIDMHEYWLLRNRLKLVMDLDSFHPGQESYFIRSLYFDDMADSSLYEKNAGVYFRKKYRIRIYNMQNDVIKLECKCKFGEYTNKESATLSLSEYESIMRRDYAFLKRGDPLKREFYHQLADNEMRPKVIVDYDREAYVCKAGDVRITFDKNLRTGRNSNDIFDHNLITHNVFDEGKMILEVKYDDFLPRFIEELLNSCAREDRSSISKYVICRVSKGNIF